MKKEDYSAFSEMLDGIADLLDKPKPTAARVSMFFRALSKYPLSTVRQALDAHIANPACGMFFPTPAHVIGQIDAMSEQQPNDDEAWSICLEASDERATVVWTGPMQASWAICKAVFDSGDRVGARMAFKGAYARLLNEAKLSGAPIVWQVSEGHDSEMRAFALKKAADMGRIAKDNELLQISCEKKEVSNAPDFVIEFAKKFKKEMIDKSLIPSLAEKELIRTNKLKQDLKFRINEYQERVKHV